MIRFYQVYDLNIVFFYDDIIVRKKNGEDVFGICFINWLIIIGEYIFLRIVEIYVKWLSFMDFGVINVNLFNIYLFFN